MGEAMETPSDLTWDDVVAVGKVVGIEVKNTGQPSSKGEPVYVVKHPADYFPTYYIDPKSAMDEVYLLSTRGAREWTITAEL